MKIYHLNLVIYQKHHIFDQSVQYVMKGFCIFSNLFDSQWVGTPIINEWTGEAVRYCHGKSISYIPASKVIRSCSYGQISLKNF